MPQANAPALDEATLASVGKLAFWSLVPGATSMRRAFVAKNWLAALKFFNDVSVMIKDKPDSYSKPE